MSQIAAWYQGYCNAIDYDACDPFGYGCSDDEETTEYQQGYGEGMDCNITVNGGICPDPVRGRSEG